MASELNTGVEGEVPAEPSAAHEWKLTAVTHVAAWLGDLQDVPRDATYWADGRFAGDCRNARSVLLARDAGLSDGPVQSLLIELGYAIEHGWPQESLSRLARAHTILAAAQEKRNGEPT